MSRNSIINAISFFDFDLVFAFSLFLMSRPFWVWGMHFPNYIFYPLLLAYVVKNTPQVKNLFLLILLLTLSLWQAIQSNVIGEAVSALSLVLIYLINKNKSIVLYNKLLKILAFFISLSIISFVLTNYLGVDLPSKIIQPLDGRNYNYRAYWFNIQPDDNSFLLYGSLTRFHSFFDEAGNIGSLCAIILYTQKFNLRTWRNRVFFMAGILSFSFFFILTCLIYFLIISFTSIKKTWPYIMLFLGIGLGFYQITKEEPFFEFFIYNRMEIEDGELAGDNRTDDVFENEYSAFLQSDDLLVGRGYGEAAKKAYDTSSYKMLIYDYGLIWFIVFVFFWFGVYFINLKSLKGKIILLSILFFMIYQRPGIMSPFLFFILSKSVFLYKENLVKRELTKK